MTVGLTKKGPDYFLTLINGDMERTDIQITQNSALDYSKAQEIEICEDFIAVNVSPSPGKWEAVKVFIWYITGGKVRSYNCKRNKISFDTSLDEDTLFNKLLKIDPDAQILTINN